MLNFILGYLILSLVIFIGVSLYVLIHERYIGEVMLVTFLWWIAYPTAYILKLIRKASKKRLKRVARNTSLLGVVGLYWSDSDAAFYSIHNDMYMWKFREEALGISSREPILFQLKVVTMPIKELQEVTDKYFTRSIKDKLTLREQEALREAYSGDLK